MSRACGLCKESKRSEATAPYMALNTFDRNDRDAGLLRHHLWQSQTSIRQSVSVQASRPVSAIGLFGPVQPLTKRAIANQPRAGAGWASMQVCIKLVSLTGESVYSCASGLNMSSLELYSASPLTRTVNEADMS